MPTRPAAWRRRRPSPRSLGALAFGAAAAVGGAAAWFAERRLVRGAGQHDDPEWEVLREAVLADVVEVEAFDGTRLHAEVTEPDAPAAGTIVFVHGYALSRHAWHYQRLALADRYRTVAYDQRGHGRSAEAPNLAGYSIDALGRDLEAVMTATVPAGERALVVGHSMGGMTVLAWAGGHPEQVHARLAGAVLVDTSGSDVLAGTVFSTGVAALAAIEQRVADRVWDALGRGSRFVDRAYLASSDLSHLLTRAVALNRHASPAHVAYTEQMFIECPSHVKAALGPAITGVDLREAAPLLTVPAVVMVGTSDRLTPPASARRLVEALPDAHLVELHGVGHTAPLEAHVEVTAEVEGLAARVLGGARIPATGERGA